MPSTLDQLLFSVTKIKLYKDNKYLDSCATGFFYRSTPNNILYLVTNRHVVTDELEPPDKLRLYLHKNTDNVTDNDWYDLPLYSSDNQPLWKTSQHVKDADIALIKIEDDTFETKFRIEPWYVKVQVPQDKVFWPGEDVFIMGYPLGIIDQIHNLPIIRRRMMASPWTIFFNKNHCFIIDAILHKGMSGSPVIAREQYVVRTKNGNYLIDEYGNLKTAYHYYLTGIYSSNYPFPDQYATETGEIKIDEDEWHSYESRSDNTERLGLGEVWYAFIIGTIIGLFEK